MAPELERLSRCGTILTLKVFRMPVGTPLPFPVIPCLDHEAMLHHHVAPHVSAYVLEPEHAGIHEVALYPTRRLLQIDTVSTLGEFSAPSHEAMRTRLRAEFPGFRLATRRPTWWRGERRVAEACRAQITLRDVLLAEPTEGQKRQIDRLQVVGALMEKQSRVASWGVRTITGPLLAAAAVVLYAALDAIAPRLGLVNVTALQYTIIGTLGGTFLYYGLKAVQLTDMANRVWKRASEYSLILGERRRLPQTPRAEAGSGLPESATHALRP